MEDKSWVKLYRKVLDNPIFAKDQTAWHVFEVLLIICDRKTGIWSGGRFQLAELANLKPITLYKALLRLRNEGMVTLDSNNKYTAIHICKWGEYQGNGNSADNNNGNNKVTTEEQQSNTLTRIENLELRTTSTSIPIVQTLNGEQELNKLKSWAYAGEPRLAIIKFLVSRYGLPVDHVERELNKFIAWYAGTEEGKKKPRYAMLKGGFDAQWKLEDWFQRKVDELNGSSTRSPQVAPDIPDEPEEGTWMLK